MKGYSVKCGVCGSSFNPNYRHWRCTRCGGPLTLEYSMRGESLPDPDLRGGITVFKRLLPVANIYTLGEGWTPLLDARIEGLNIVFKVEGANPTGSFKDRGAAVAVSKAKELGVKAVREDSSGNAGISISAYSALAGIKAKIYVPRDAPEHKKVMIRAFGAEIVEAETRDEASKLVVSGLGEDEYYIGHLWNPYFVEGVKTICYEIYVQTGRLPSYTFAPTSSGTLLLGMYRGMKDLMEMGYISGFSRLVAVQSKGYSPLHHAITGEPVSREKTRVADALRISNPPRLREMVDAIRDTRGYTCVPEDEEIIEAHKLLLRRGLIVEPTSAASLAAALKMRREGILDSGEEVCVILTGTGIKTLDRIVWV